jgi:tetratricopeptide (TPR) repeat protein
MTRFIPLLALVLAACAIPSSDGPPRPEAISLLGDTLYAPAFDAEEQARLQADLDAAIEEHADAPGSVDAYVWKGRRTAYMWRYQDAIDIYSAGLEEHPDNAELLRHRGHRYISIRNYAAATVDLSRAASLVRYTPDVVEPDGQPNAAGIPTSTLKTNILYHLGLANYLRAQFDDAARAFQECFDLAENDDMRVAAADWLYMSLQRDGQSEAAEAAIAFVEPDMELLENHSYYRRLQMYRGWMPADSLLGAGEALDMATQGYGVGNWYLVNGDTSRATGIFSGVIETDYWAAFGYIAAEADLARLRR